MKLISSLTIIGLVTLSMTVSAEQVQNVSAQAQGGGTVNLTWDSIDDVAYYDVYENSTDRIATGVTSTSYVREGLSLNTTYQYFVTACMGDGTCGEASLQATVTTSSAGVAVEYSAEPVAVIADNGDGTASLSWSSVAAAEGYNVYVNNQYLETIYGLNTTIAFDAANVVQVAWFGGGEYPAKSAPAMTAEVMGDGSWASLDSASSGSSTDVEIYFTRHAEKMTELSELENGNFQEVCGEDKCSEVLNAKGELRAEMLVDAFATAGVTDRLTHAFSSHKTRTRQTIEAIVAAAGLTGDIDKNAGDGIQEYPVLNNDGSANATELDPESTSGSEEPTIEALMALPAGSVALVAGHSGTLYDIMAGLGLADVCLSDTVETCDQNRYPIDSKVKVKNFGDIWKIVLNEGVASFAYRINLQPKALAVHELSQ